MASVTEQPPETRSLEDQLQDLAAEEKRLKNRLDNLQIITMVAAIVGFIIAIVALGVALGNSGRTTTYVTRTPASTASRSPGTATGAGGMMGTGRAASARTINVQLGEMFVRPSSTSISAGKVTFVARNTGQVPHELMVERVPIKMDGPGKPTESAAMGMIDDMLPGHTGKMAVKLSPGTYELFCNVTGHYAAGQHTVFTVTQ